MARPPKVIFVWQCPTCGWRYTDPLGATVVFCPNDHGRQTKKLVVIWRKGDPPLEELELTSSD